MSESVLWQNKYIVPDWPAPVNIKAYTTTRLGGESLSPYDSFNTALHVDDDPHRVQANRRLLNEELQLPSQPRWLQQVHGTRVIVADDISQTDTADASFTTKPNVVCVVQTADCLPLIMCDRAGKSVAAIHAGWRGLLSGVIEATRTHFTVPSSELLVWLGPAISQEAFVVGDDVRQAFTAVAPQAGLAFVPAEKPLHWRADIYRLAKQRLQDLGIEAVYGGNFCTYAQSEYFYSYRREVNTGRMATLIWQTEQ